MTNYHKTKQTKKTKTIKTSMCLRQIHSVSCTAKKKIKRGTTDHQQRQPHNISIDHITLLRKQNIVRNIKPLMQ